MTKSKVRRENRITVNERLLLKSGLAETFKITPSLSMILPRWGKITIQTKNCSYFRGEIDSNNISTRDV
jgi:hypothetical protein